jgi:hypothetical protein
MFEFHGWASVQYHTFGTDSTLQDQCWQQLCAYVGTIPNKLIQLQRYNGCDSLHIVGQHNHRSGYVIEVFQWIANHAPGSYGILYIRDDEDSSLGSDYSNCFRVWRLRRGKLEEMADPFLSPVIPTVEDMCDDSLPD